MFGVRTVGGMAGLVAVTSVLLIAELLSGPAFLLAA